MLPITDPRVDPQGTLDDALWVALAVDPSANQLAGTANLGSEFRTMPANVALSDFYAEMYFTIPHNNRRAPGRLDSVSGPMPLATSTTSTCRWKTATRPGISVREHPVAAIRCCNPAASAGARSYARRRQQPDFMVYQGVAILSGNDFGLDAVVELPTAPTTGDVFVEVGFTPANPVETATLPMSVSDFSVWDMSAGMVLDVLDIPSGSLTTGSL